MVHQHHFLVDSDLTVVYFTDTDTTYIFIVVDGTDPVSYTHLKTVKNLVWQKQQALLTQNLQITSRILPPYLLMENLMQ